MADIGTTRWFGESWGAAVCHPDAQIPVPLGTSCAGCGVSFAAGHQGISIPRVNRNLTVGREAHHLDCFLHAITGV